MTQKIIDVLSFILQRFQDEGISLPGKTRLIKLLYLSEVEYYRAFQRRLTDLTWRFYYFGPYSSELEEILGKPEFDEEKIEIADEKILKQISLYFPGERELLDDATRAIVARIVKRWGDEQLNALLDYVYFETEPMEKVKRGQIIDFSNIQKREVPKEISLDPEKMKLVREKLHHLANSFKRRRYLKFNAELEEETMKWGEGESVPTLKGKVVIGLEDIEDENEPW